MRRSEALPALVAALVPLLVCGVLWWPVPLHLGSLRPLTAFSDSHIWVFEQLYRGLVEGGAVDPTCAAGYPALRSFRPIAGAPALLWLGLRPLLGALAAGNLVQLLSLPLSALAAHLLLRRSMAVPAWTAAALAATYALSPNLLGTFATGEISNTQAWIPPAFLLAWDAARQRTLGLLWVALVGLLSALTSPYLALALPLMAGCLALGRAAGRPGAAALGREAAGLAVLALALLPAWFVYRPDAAGGGASVFRPARSSPLLGVDLPRPSPIAQLDSLLWGEGHSVGSPFETVHVAALGLPLLLLALGLLGWHLGRRPLNAALVRGLGLLVGGSLLALGPWLAVGGQVLSLAGLRLHGPVALLEALGWPTAMGGLYFRYVVIAVLGLVVIAGALLQDRRLGGLAWICLAANLVFGLSVSGSPWPRPAAAIDGADWLSARADGPGPADDGAVLELPLQGPTDAHFGQAGLLRAVLHGRPTTAMPRSVVHPGDPTRRLWLEAWRQPEGLRAALSAAGVRLVLLPQELALHVNPPLDRLVAELGPPDLDGALLAWDLGPTALRCVALEEAPGPPQPGRQRISPPRPGSPPPGP